MKNLRMKKSENENLRIKKSENRKSETNNNLIHFGVSMQVFLQLETLSEQRRSECRRAYTAIVNPRL